MFVFISLKILVVGFKPGFFIWIREMLPVNFIRALRELSRYRLKLSYMQKPVLLILDNTLQFLREQGADPETLKLIQQQCTAQAG